MENREEKKPFNRKRDDRPRREESDIDKKLVSLRRVTKVVKGGRTMKFSAVVVVGDKKGSIGIGMGKAKEVPLAIEKATTNGRKNMQKVNVVNGTIPHETTAAYGASKIILLPAKEGTGVIAGGSARSVIELAGIKNIVTKIHGSSNKTNCVKATLKGLLSLRTKEQIAALRGKSVEEI
ncbi:MAG: 30S ribosomal protein S5 [Clostridia bacterium]